MKKLLEKILTKEDVLLLKEQIFNLKQLSFKKDGLLSEKCKGLTSPELIQLIMSAEDEGKINFAPKTQSDFLEDLQKKLDNLSLLKLTLAFSPTPKLIKKICELARKESNEMVILDISVNPEIVGGAILEYKGKYLNLSLVNEVKKFIKKRWRNSKNI